MTAQASGSSLTSSTIAGTGELTLNSGLGSIPLPPLPTGFQLQVTTVPNGYNGLFGEVSTAQITFPDSTVLVYIVSPFAALIGSQANTASQGLAAVGQSLSLPSLDLGIGLGGQVSSMIQDTPADPAVPYLYFAANSGLTYGIGTASVKIASYSGSVVVHPADPSLYVHVSGLPAVSNIALGISQNGYIPFTPEVTPSHFSGQTLYGDIYVTATLDLADLTEDKLPFAVTATLDFNLDTSGNGWTSTIGQTAAQFISGNFSAVSLTRIQIALGANFSTSLLISLEGAFAYDIPLRGGTLIYNGPTHEMDLAGTTFDNPFQGTPVAFLDSGPDLLLDLDVHTDTNQFDLRFAETFTVFGYQVAGASLDFNNTQINVSGATEFLNAETYVSGTITYGGHVDLAGTTSVYENQDLTWQGWGFTVGFVANVSFVIDDGSSASGRTGLPGIRSGSPGSMCIRTTGPSAHTTP